MMKSLTYRESRSRLEAYFDRTAAATWAKLTSDGPVSRIRRTVRAGRERMRSTMLSYLPEDLSGLRILDAGCGTGALAVEAVRRGADVVAIDLSGTLVGLARERLPEDIDPTRIEFRVGDMLDPELGEFDYVVAMDSLIHYEAADMVEMVRRLAQRARRGVVVTFAPRTLLLTLMHWVGKLFPRSDRSPAIVPIREATLRRCIVESSSEIRLTCGRTLRIDSGFYISQALEVVRE